MRVGAIAVMLALSAYMPSPAGTPSRELVCPCPQNCNNECPEPPDEETTDCQITGASDPCSYPPNGCPSGENEYNGCCFLWGTPILIDLGGGFQLTSLQAGVRFPIGPSNFLNQVSWTHPAANNAWLALDRNGNGRIDNGTELFGNFTPQPDPPPGKPKHGFRALAVYDLAPEGGNGDERIDATDPIFRSLLLWRDENHDGMSQSSELRRLFSAGVTGIDLRYKTSPRRDEFGNEFRYRSKIYSDKNSTVEKWAYDVFLQVSRIDVLNR